MISQKICPSGTCQWDLIWKDGLSRHKEVKNLEMRSSWIRVGLKSSNFISNIKETRHRHREGSYGKREAGWRDAAIARGHQQALEAGRNKEGFFPRTFRKRMALPTS